MIAALTTLVAAKSRRGFWNCCVSTAARQIWPESQAAASARLRQPLVISQHPDVADTLDFMSDIPYGGRRFQTLNIV